MILRSVGLENFGRFRGRTVEFRRGMNLVIGPNEAGKSTLAEAVPAVLFGTDRLEKFKPWGRSACSASLFFEGHGRTVEVKRNLVTDEVELIEKDDLYHVLSQFSGKVPLGGRTASCREYAELLEKLLGIADEKLFRATYLFGHHPQEWTGEELAHKLRTLVGGTPDADYAAILDGLLADHFELTRSNPWGRDKQRDREYEEVCRALEEADDTDAVPLFVEIDNSAELDGQIEALSAELVADRVEREKGLRYIERMRRLAAERAAEAAAAPTPEAAPEPPRPVAAALPDDEVAARLVEVGLPASPPRELPELLAEAADIRQELATLQQPFAALGAREKQVPTVPWAALAGVLAVLLVATGASWWFDFQLIIVAAGAGLAAAGVIGWGVLRHRARGLAQEECEEERARLENQKHAAQQRQAFLSERCEALGLPSSAIDLVRLQKLVTAHRDLLERCWSADGAGVAEAPTVNVDRPSTEPVAPHPPVAAAQDPELVELEARMADFEVALRGKEARLAELVRQKESPPSPSAPAKVSAATLRARRLELEQRIGVLRTAVDLLAGAVEEYGRTHMTRLDGEAGKLLGKLTAGRYGELRLDRDMSPSVQVEGRRWLSCEHFSRGTVDAIYVALRMALARVRNDGRALPLMLDDPFVHLDQKRLAVALNLVDLAAADGQLILFSHNVELGKRAARERWHVVPLDGGPAVSGSEEGGEHAGQLHLL